MVVNTTKKAIDIARFLVEKVDSIKEGVQSIGIGINSLATSFDNGTIRIKEGTNFHC
jgi:hypothetical protein